MHLKPEPFNTECNQYSLLPTTCTNIQHLSIEHPPTHTHTHTHTHTDNNNYTASPTWK